MTGGPSRCIHRDDMAVPEDWIHPWILVFDENTVLQCESYEAARLAESFGPYLAHQHWSAGRLIHGPYSRFRPRPRSAELTCISVVPTRR